MGHRASTETQKERWYSKGANGSKREQMDLKEPKRTQKDSKGPKRIKRTKKDPKGPKRTQ